MPVCGPEVANRCVKTSCVDCPQVLAQLEFGGKINSLTEFEIALLVTVMSADTDAVRTRENPED